MTKNINSDIFIQLGLTIVQKEVYLSLLSLENAKVQTVAKYLTIDRAQVYRALTKLEKIGLVQKILTKPIKYMAVPLEQAFPILINLKKEEISNIQKEANKFKDKFDQKKRFSPSNEPQGYILEIQNLGHEKNVKSLFEEVQKNMDMICTPEALKHALLTFADEHIKALKRGVKVRIITSEIKKHNIKKFVERFKKFGTFTLRESETSNLAAVALFDDNAVDIITSSEKVEILRARQKDVVLLIKDYFELKWNSAKQV
ncbi:MAG: TrmB family transcriptional regulator [archaeon]